MFEASLLDSTQPNRRTMRLGVAGLSIAIQACVLTILLALPLLHPEHIVSSVTAPRPCASHRLLLPCPGLGPWP